METSNCSSSVTPTPGLDAIFGLTGQTDISKACKIFFENQIHDEKFFANDIAIKIAEVNATLTLVCTAIREMETRSDNHAWKDALYCLKKNKARLELKLSRLNQLEEDNLNGVKQLQVQSDMMDLCDEDYDMS